MVGLFVVPRSVGGSGGFLGAIARPVGAWEDQNMGTRKSNWLAKLMCAEPSKQSQHLVEFWQREAHRYEATSRRLVTRMRVEVALSLPILISIMTIAFGNEQLIVLLAVPPLVAIVGSLVLWTVQESFSADAHLHYAETMVAQNIATYDSKYPTWGDHGGKLGRTGYPFRLVIVLGRICTHRNRASSIGVGLQPGCQSGKRVEAATRNVAVL
jgi:hypothetical protein